MQCRRHMCFNFVAMPEKHIRACMHMVAKKIHATLEDCLRRIYSWAGCRHYFFLLHKTEAGIEKTREAYAARVF